MGLILALFWGQCSSARHWPPRQFRSFRRCNVPIAALADLPQNHYLPVEPRNGRCDDQSRHNLPSRPRQSRPRRRTPRSRARPFRRRRRRAVPRIQPDRSADVRQRPAEAGDLRHLAGLWPARGEGRRGRLCAFLRRVAAGADPRGGCGRGRARRLLRQLRGRPRAYQRAALRRRQSARCAGLREPRSNCSPRSTPICATRIRGCGR